MGSWRLGDLLHPAVLKSLVDSGLLPQEAKKPIQWETPDYQEVRALLYGARQVKGQVLTMAEVVALMADFPGRQPRGTYLTRSGKRYRQRTRLPHSAGDEG